MQIIRPRKHGTTVSYWQRFQAPDERSYFAFECSAGGTVKEPLHWSYLQCLEDVKAGKMEALGVYRREHAYTIAAIGRCDRCWRTVRLGASINTCECGADYNLFGQAMAPREQWGEETGEHWTDIIFEGGEE